MRATGTLADLVLFTTNSVKVIDEWLRVRNSKETDEDEALFTNFLFSVLQANG